MGKGVGVGGGFPIPGVSFRHRSSLKGVVKIFRAVHPHTKIERLPPHPQGTAVYCMGTPHSNLGNKAHGHFASTNWPPYIFSTFLPKKVNDMHQDECT